MTDYKFFCFGGEHRVMYIGADRSNNPTSDFFDMNFQHLPIQGKDPNAAILPKKPTSFEEMKCLAAKLSEGFSHVRVDFYNIRGRIYFGELTLYHCAGFQPFCPDEWNLRLGDWICLDM